MVGAPHNVSAEPLRKCRSVRSQIEYLSEIGLKLISRVWDGEGRSLLKSHLCPGGTGRMGATPPLWPLWHPVSETWTYRLLCQLVQSPVSPSPSALRTWVAAKQTGRASARVKQSRHPEQIWWEAGSHRGWAHTYRTPRVSASQPHPAFWLSGSRSPGDSFIHSHDLVPTAVQALC